MHTTTARLRLFLYLRTWEITRRHQYPVPAPHHRVCASLLPFHVRTSFLKVRNLIPVIVDSFTLLFRPLFLLVQTPAPPPMCECPPPPWAAAFAVLHEGAVSACPGFHPSSEAALPSWACLLLSRAPAACCRLSAHVGALTLPASDTPRADPFFYGDALLALLGSDPRRPSTPGTSVPPPLDCDHAIQPALQIRTPLLGLTLVFEPDCPRMVCIHKN